MAQPRSTDIELRLGERLVQAIQAGRLTYESLSPDEQTYVRTYLRQAKVEAPNLLIPPGVAQPAHAQPPQTGGFLERVGRSAIQEATLGVVRNPLPPPANIRDTLADLVGTGIGITPSVLFLPGVANTGVLRAASRPAVAASRVALGRLLGALGQAPPAARYIADVIGREATRGGFYGAYRTLGETAGDAARAALQGEDPTTIIALGGTKLPSAVAQHAVGWGALGGPLVAASGLRAAARALTTRPVDALLNAPEALKTLERVAQSPAPNHSPIPRQLEPYIRDLGLTGVHTMGHLRDLLAVAKTTTRVPPPGALGGRLPRPSQPITPDAAATREAILHALQDKIALRTTTDLEYAQQAIRALGDVHAALRVLGRAPATPVLDQAIKAAKGNAKALATEASAYARQALTYVDEALNAPQSGVDPLTLQLAKLQLTEHLRRLPTRSRPPATGPRGGAPGSGRAPAGDPTTSATAAQTTPATPPTRSPAPTTPSTTATSPTTPSAASTLGGAPTIADRVRLARAALDEYTTRLRTVLQNPSDQKAVQELGAQREALMRQYTSLIGVQSHGKLSALRGKPLPPTEAKALSGTIQAIEKVLKPKGPQAAKRAKRQRAQTGRPTPKADLDLQVSPSQPAPASPPIGGPPPPTEGFF